MRLLRERHLQAAAGFYAAHQASRKINEEAAQAMRAMELFNGKTLTPALKRRSDEYALEVLGDLEYAPWLYVYSMMRGEFRDGWMPGRKTSTISWSCRAS